MLAQYSGWTTWSIITNTFYWNFILILRKYDNICFAYEVNLQWTILTIYSLVFYLKRIYFDTTHVHAIYIFFLNNQMIGKSRRIVQKWKGKLAIKFQLTIKVYINLNGNDYRIKTFPPVTMPVNSTEESVALDGFQREGGGDEVGHAVFTRTDEISVSSPDPESANTVSVSYWILLTMGILKNTLQSTGTWLINFSYS